MKIALVFFVLCLMFVFGIFLTAESFSQHTISSLPSAYSWFNDCDIATGLYGASVSSAGDVNKDGYDDIIIGAYLAESGYSDEGLAFAYLGSDSGISTVPFWTNGPNQETAHYGISVASAGDVNGDGYGDVIVGAEFFDRDNVNEGQAFVYLGDSIGLGAFPYWTGESNQMNSKYGFSVASAGDINGDGLDDIIVGAYMFGSGQIEEGKVFLYYGSDSVISAYPDWEDESNISYASFGCSVASAGDVNGDGYDDVIIGAYLYDSLGSYVGSAFVYYGSSSGLSSTHDWQAVSSQVNSHFGYSVSTAGDVNNDGYDDVLVGAHTYDNAQTDEGAVFVYFGDSLGLGNIPQVIEINSANSYFGFSVASAGDVNGDGYDDIMAGASHYSNSLTYEGGAFLYYGNAGGVETTPSWTYESNQFQAMLGYSVSSAGDVNGDGYSDVLVGAIMYDEGETDEGCVFGFYGAADPVGIETKRIGERSADYIEVVSGMMIVSCGEKDSEVHIYDSAGRCVFSQSNLQNGINKIKTSALERGVYFIKLNGSSSAVTKKTVIIK
ncbi:MAG: FG-GAP-like repeat-containing protein [bacterium]